MLRVSLVRAASLLGLILAVSSVQAQILLKPAGYEMEPLHQKSLNAEVKITGQFATTKMTHIFANPTRSRVEAEFVYTLPEGATVTSFAYWCGDEKVVAYVAEKERARKIYKMITDRQHDPALVELVGKRTFHAKIFPVMPLADLKVEVTWVSAIPSKKGIPTYTLPIAQAKKEDQLESLKAHIEIQKEPWVQSIMNNQGIQPVENGSIVTLGMEATKVRPSEDLRIGLKPASDSVVASLFSGRSAGTDGYFAFNAISANKPQFKVPGVKFFSIHQHREGNNVVVTGKFSGHGQGTVMLGNRKADVVFTDEAFPDHLGVKLWAVDEINLLTRSGASSKKIIALSMQHGMPSKYTAWIAIPVAERKLYEQMVKQERVRDLVQTYVKNVFDHKGDSAEGRALKSEIDSLAKESQMEPRWIIEEFAYEELYNRVGKLSRTLLKGSNPNLETFKTRVKAFEPIARHLGIRSERILENVLSGQLWDTMEHLAQLEVTGNTDSQEWKRNRRIVDTYCQLTSQKYENMLEEHRQNAVLNEASKLLDLAYRDRISDSKRRARADQIIGYMKKYKVQQPGYYFDRYYDVSQDLAKAHLKEKVDPKQVAAANRWLDTMVMMKLAKRDEAIAQGVTNYLAQRSAPDISAYFQAARKSSFTSPEAVKHLKNLAKIWAPCEPEIRNNAKGPISSVSKEIGRELGWKAIQNHDLTGTRTQLDEIKKVLMSIYPDAPNANDKALQSAFDEAMKNGVMSHAWGLLYERSSLTQTKKDIARKKKEFEDVAKWAGLDPDKIYNDVVENSDEESKVRYEFLQLQLSESTDTARIARLEARLRQLTLGKTRTYKDDRIERIRVNAQADVINDQLDNTSDIETRNRLMTQYNELIRRARVIAARMGDPLLTAKLPQTDSNVTATFPWGETRPMIWNEKTGLFECRFDIPPTATEGLQDVVIEATEMLGNRISEKSSIHVDLTAPKFTVSVQDGRIEVTDLSGDIARIKAFIDDGKPVDLVRGANSTWWVNADVHANQSIRVIVTDRAHNRSEYPEAKTETTAEPAKLDLGPSTWELSGKNIQTLGKLGNLVFAGTLDEGLWVRSKDDAWTMVQGLPSQCPRTMVEFGGKLIVRFGDGTLLEFAPDMTWKTLTDHLPRKEAMALATDGQSLFVAQPGGYSEFDGAKWTNHFDIEALRGQSVSVMAATSDKVWIGLQGKGLLSLDRTNGKVESFDETSGLTDDWITQILPTAEGVTIGTFVGGALEFKDQAFVLVAGTGEKCVTSTLLVGEGSLIGTRTGLFLRTKDSNQEIVAKGLGEEIQSLVAVGDTIWIGTRNGVFSLTIK